jgi:uncharacterized protein DUF5663
LELTLDSSVQILYTIGMAKNNLDTFITNLIDQRGYEEAPQEIKEQLSKDLKARLDKFVVSRTVAEFADKEVDEFEKMLDEDKPTEELTQFAKSHIPDYQTFMTTTLLLFRDAYLL